MDPVKLHSMYTRTTKLIQTNCTIGQFSYLFFHWCSWLSSEFPFNRIYTLSFHTVTVQILELQQPTTKPKHMKSSWTFKHILPYWMALHLSVAQKKYSDDYLCLCKHHIHSKEYSKATTTWAASENPGHIHAYSESSNNLGKDRFTWHYF